MDKEKAPATESNVETTSNRGIFRRLLYAQVIIVVCVFLVALGNIYYTNHVDTRSNHQFCDLMEAIDIPVPSNAPPRSRDVNRRVHQLRVNLGCINDH